jgi:iron complex transport system ATP-binding protein
MTPQTLILSNISYSFTPEKSAVQSISAEFAPGKLTVLIGPNGSGKTTLLRLASGLLSPQEGKVSLNGRSIARISRRERARLIALLPQREESLPDMTVMDLVLLGRTPHLSLLAQEGPADRDLAMAAMKETGVAELYNRPLDTLSGGELQRAAIARALCQHTPVLLLDEPVASLDIGHQATVMNLLARLAREQNLAVACVLHDLNLAAHFADHVLLLLHGQLICSGAPEEVLKEDTLLRAYGIPVKRISMGPSFAMAPDFGEDHQEFPAFLNKRVKSS